MLGGGAWFYVGEERQPQHGKVSLAGRFDLKGLRAHRLYLAVFVVWVERMSDGEGDDDDATKVDQ